MNTKTMNGEAHETRTKRPPTDLELMMYVDGELEGERLREVRQAVSRDDVLRSKVAALSLSGAIVRENAESDFAGIDLSDGIMARIAADKSPTREARDEAPGPTAPALAPEPKEAEVKPLLRPGLGKVAAKSPSNDNSRGIFALAAIAVAAAAGLMIWGRMDVATPGPQAPVAAVTTPAEAPAEPAQAPAEAPRVAETDTEESDDEVGVAVAAVDFGAKIGTIFYVPTEAATSNHTTTVVWLADDSAGGEQ